MDPQFLHHTDPLTWEFEADVTACTPLPDGRWAVLLDRTYFYPTGGGQEHDSGQVGEAQVVDVYKDGEPPYAVHVLDRPLLPGRVRARIDGDRRLLNMQHHTAQHLLSQCFLRLFEIDSVSAHIRGVTPSSLDVNTSKITRPDLDKVEALANQIIYENRPVKFYFVAPEELKALPLRWPPHVSENIRIVEIEGFDYTPCGGTHCTRTGAIGMLKILKAERQGSQTRLWFVAGGQAWQTFGAYQAVLSDLSVQLGVGFSELPAAFQRQAEQLKAAQFELQALRQDQLARQAVELVAQAPQMGVRRFVRGFFAGRSLEELRMLSNLLKTSPGVVAALVTTSGGQYSVLVSCAEDTGLSARDLLASALAQAGGRGGGNPRLAQGGGPGGEEQARLILDAIEIAINK